MKTVFYSATIKAVKGGGIFCCLFIFFKEVETIDRTEARRLLEDTGTDREMTERICWLIGHHHTYGHIQDMDHQILVEADFLVNLAEDHASDEAVRHVMKTVFRTESGIRFLKSLWPV